MEVPIMFAVFAGLVAILMAASHHFTKKRKAAWRSVAERLGLRSQEDQISGTLTGIPLVVSIIVRGPEKNRSQHTHFVMEIKGDLPAGLSITAEGVFNKMAKLAGSQDVQLGLHRLDSKLLVRAHNEAEVYDWARRIRIQEGLGLLVEIKNGSFLIADNKLTFECPTVIADAATLETYIRDLTTIASGLSDDAVGSIDLDHAMDDDTDDNNW